MRYFRVGICPYCDGQGVMNIIKDINSGRISLVCSECDTEFNTYQQLLNNENPHLYQGGKMQAPTMLELEEQHWLQYINFEL